MLLGDANSIDLPLKKTSSFMVHTLQILHSTKLAKINPKMKTHVGVGKPDV